MLPSRFGWASYLQGICWTLVPALAVVRELDVKLVDDAWTARQKHEHTHTHT